MFDSDAPSTEVARPLTPEEQAAQDEEDVRRHEEEEYARMEREDALYLKEWFFGM